MLAAVNAVGGALLDGFAELDRRPRCPDDGPGAVELLLTARRGQGQRRAQLGRRGDRPRPAAERLAAEGVAEARFLAERLRELVDSGDAERGEIVVLLRAFTHVDAYEEALERAGLRPYVVGGRGYWTQQQVEDLLRLLGVVANPLDDERLFGALASFAVRRRAPTRSGCCAGARAARAAARGTSGRCSSGASATDASPTTPRREWLEQIDDRGRGPARALLRDPRRACAPRRPLLPLDDAGRADDERLRLRPRRCSPAAAAAAGWRTCAS